jgi:hypothetical protein
MKNKKTLKEIIHYIEGTNCKICIIGKNFISLGYEDKRGQHGWRVETIFKHNIKDFPLEFIIKYKMDKILFSSAKI